MKHASLRRGWIGGSVMVLLALAQFVPSQANLLHAQTVSCSLQVNSAYRASNSRGVYYVSDDCTKRPIRNPAVYFSHFASWADVHVVSPQSIANVPDSSLSFLPWGPRRTFQTGSLIKTVDDANVYLIADNTRRPISNEAAFTGLGFQWSWVEDVVPAVMNTFPIGAAITSANTYPDGVAVKYPDSPRVYVLDTVNGQTQRQYVNSIETLRTNYRADHIVTLPASKTFPDSQTPIAVTPPPVTPPTTPPAAKPPTTPAVTAPGTPFNLAAPTITATSVVLTWRDNSTNEDHFIVQRRIGTGAFSDVATLDPNTVTYTDTSVQANQQYRYRIQAVNSKGSGSSSEIMIRTLVAPVTPVPPSPPNSTSTPNNGHPTVTVSGPSTAVSGTSITLTATATDSDGTITNVEFLNGSTVIGSDSTNPYSVVWSGATVGTHTITARATDNGNAQTVSSPLTIIVTAVVTPPPQPPSPPPSTGQTNTANANSAVGTNVTQFRDWASEISFKDAFRRARPWTCTGTCTYDTNGWPTSGQASTVIFAPGPTFLDGRMPTGQYIVLYSGSGTISYRGAGVKDVANSRAGRDVLDVNTANGGITINTSGSVQNIRVILPGGECNNPFTFAASSADCSGTYTSNESSYVTQPFYPLFLARMQNYKSIRFCWWMLPDPYVKTPRLTTPITWADRPLPTDAIWAGNGVPIESMVQLANTLNADPWFNIPHLSDDLIGNPGSSGYVHQLATYVRDHLNPNLKSYIEYANEVWNGGPGGYEQAEYAQAQGTALGLSSDPNQARFRYQADQSVKMFQIWNTVYGTRSTDRIVRVLAAQSANPWTGQQLMDWHNAYLEADALAVAPYIDVPAPDQSMVAGYTVDQLFNYITNSRLPTIQMLEEQNVTNAQAHTNSLGRPLELVAYEGGQHLVEIGANVNNTNMNTIMNNANLDPRMGTVYQQFFANWKQAGGHLFEHFVNVMQQATGSVGRFGALESQLQTSSPKYDAIQAFIQANPKWW